MFFSAIRKWIGGEEYYLRTFALLRQLSVVLLLFQICRLTFFIVNFNFFAPLKVKDLANSFAYGIQYDLSAIVKYNFPYILCILIPTATLFRKTNYRRFINSLFISLNSLAVLLSISDIEYFKFANKRTTFELTYYLKTMHAELIKLIPAYMVQYWYLFILFVAMIILIIRIRYTNRYLHQEESKEISPARKAILLGLMLLFLFIIARGTGKSELKSSDCVLIAPVEYNSLATNTPFVLIESFMMGKSAYKGPGQENPYDFAQKYKSTAPFRSLNVVIIILESFSKEYISSLNGNKGATPFLDSLIKQSYVCSSAFANGRATLQALPAILCSEPSLGEIPLALQMDRIRDLNSIANILSQAGYGTAFFTEPEMETWVLIILPEKPVFEAITG